MSSSALRSYLMQQELGAMDEVNPYVGMSQQVMAAPAYSPVSSPGMNIGASFVQGFAAGAFNSLAQERQQQIQERRTTALTSKIAEMERAEYAQMLKAKELEGPKQLGDIAVSFDADTESYQPVGRTRFPKTSAGAAGSGMATNPYFAGTQVAQQPQQQMASTPDVIVPNSQPTVSPLVTAAMNSQQQVPMSVPEGQTPVRTGGQLAEAIAMTYGPNATKDTIEEVIKTKEPEATKLLAHYKQLGQLEPRMRKAVEQAGETGSAINRGWNSIASQFGDPAAKQARKATRDLKGLSSEYTAINTSARGLLGTQLDSDSSLEVFLADRIDPTADKEYNLDIVNRIPQQRAILADKFKALTGRTPDEWLNQKKNDAVVAPTAMQAPSVQNVPSAPAPEQEEMSVKAYNAANQILPKLNKESREYVPKVLARYDGPLVATEASDELLDALITTESSGNSKAVSPKGATGLTQVMPATWAEVEQQTGQKFDKNSPEDQRTVGKIFLDKKLKEFDGNVPLALAAYNGGPAQKLKGGGKLNEWWSSAKNDLGFGGVQTANAEQAPQQADAQAEAVAALQQRTDVPAEKKSVLLDTVMRAYDNAIVPFGSIGAYVNAAIDTGSVSGPEFTDTYKAYKEGIADARANSEQAMSGVPGANMAFDVASSVVDPTTYLGAGAVKGAIKGTQTLGKAIATGAAAGGIASGSREGIDVAAGASKYQDSPVGAILGETAKGAGIGAVAGAGANVAGKVIGKGAEALKKGMPESTLRGDAGAVRVKTTPAEAEALAKKASESKAVKQLAKRLQNLTPTQLDNSEKLLTEAKKAGVPVNLADAIMEQGGRSAQEFTRFISNFGDVSDEATERLTSRASKQGDRIKSYAKDIAPGAITTRKASDDFVKVIDSKVIAAEKARSEAATPLYTKGRERMPIIEGETATRALENPRIKKAIAEVRRELPELDDLPDNHIDVLHKARAVIRDDVIPELKISGKKNSLSYAMQAKKKLDGLIQKNPDFAKADKIFAEGSGDVNQFTKPQYKAIQAIAKKNPSSVTKAVMRLETDDLEQLMGSLRKENAQEVRGLVRSHIQQQVNNTKDLTSNQNPLANLVETPAQRDKLRTILGEGATTDKLMKQLELEGVIRKGNRKLAEGSSSKSLLGEEAKKYQEAAEEALSVGGDLARGNFTAPIVRGVMKLYTKVTESKLPRETQLEILDQLTIPTNAPESLKKLRKEIERLRKASKVGQAAKGATETATSRGILSSYLTKTREEE